MYHALNVLISLSGESGQQGKLAELLSTHPNAAKRAAHVKDMCESAGYKMSTKSNNNSSNPKGSSTKPNVTKPKKTNGNDNGNNDNGSTGVGKKPSIKKN